MSVSIRIFKEGKVIEDKIFPGEYIKPVLDYLQENEIDYRVDKDAEDLYKYASSPEVWPAAWWPVHTSVENSLEIIHNVLSKPETYAIIPKDNNNHPVGSIWLMVWNNSNIWVQENEAEVWYWIGVPYQWKWFTLIQKT